MSPSSARAPRAPFTTALQALRSGGRAVLLSIVTQSALIAPMDLIRGEKSLIGSLSHVWDQDFREALQLLGRGAVQAAPLITDRIPLSAADLGYPVWCRGTLPLDCKGRTAVTAWRQPAVVGGLQVRPGDLVVADDDGAVVIPAELTEETIGRALAKASKEHGLRDALEAGSTLRAAYDQFGVL
jgi:hypothetical protein